MFEVSVAIISTEENHGENSLHNISFLWKEFITNNDFK
jgi:hypothetical protein